ncbi:Haloacid dehalogenase, type II [Naviculisporaceae sp. PSN 640]
MTRHIDLDVKISTSRAWVRRLLNGPITSSTHVTEPMAMSTLQPSPPRNIKAVFFDFMGTCLNWHASVSASLPSALSSDQASGLALEWRRQYFIWNQHRLAQNLPPEDIDVTLFRTLQKVVAEYPSLSDIQKSSFDFSETGTSNVKTMIQAWHNQPPWPDVAPVLSAIKQEFPNLEMFVHANGTTRLQLDLVKSSELAGYFSMLFSSQLLGVYKPHEEPYLKALELVKLRPEEVLMVAAHAYDLRGAKKVGLKTVYVPRWTDDVDEDLERIKREQEFDFLLEGGVRGLVDVVRNLV